MLKKYLLSFILLFCAMQISAMNKHQPAPQDIIVLSDAAFGVLTGTITAVGIFATLGALYNLPEQTKTNSQKLAIYSGLGFCIFGCGLTSYSFYKSFNPTKIRSI
jgi:hypothetical protein